MKTTYPVSPAVLKARVERSKILDAALLAIHKKYRDAHRIRHDDGCREWERLHAQSSVVWQAKLEEVPLSPQDEIDLAAAICEHAPQGAKAAGALAFVWRDRSRDEFTFTAPSHSHPGAVHTQKAKRDSELVRCSCIPGSLGKLCWHKTAAKRLMMLVIDAEVLANPADHITDSQYDTDDTREPLDTSGWPAGARVLEGVNR